MEVRLFYHSKVTPWDCNLEIVFRLLEKLKRNGIKLELIDLSKLPEEERLQAYFKAVTPSVWKKYRIRRVFGSRNYPATFFGREVPALLVFENNKSIASDVYPHEEFGKVISIEEFLNQLLNGVKK
ncbi:MAG: hypothetical protein NC827_09775 [Candidatus Omnitrophica bacterium]|nr:hypothetical protein [Candidatus Omnitrophota bacterium]